ncbi:hypothetical protein CDAR_586551 [Caerostris darwini]|uniref:Uncharacterized protein n=1 Tax=Caerostris darwini TaxID=1538125 RepID=A0AAV4Q890_9ARAC|nr:hypothetical protein CDAR_586551 [Caerostris darwini]
MDSLWGIQRRLVISDMCMVKGRDMKGQNACLCTIRIPILISTHLSCVRILLQFSANKPRVTKDCAAPTTSPYKQQKLGEIKKENLRIPFIQSIFPTRSENGVTPASALGSAPAPKMNIHSRVHGESIPFSLS